MLSLSGGLYQLAAAYERYPECVDQVRQLQGIELNIYSCLKFRGIEIRKSDVLSGTLSRHGYPSQAAAKLTYLHVPSLSVPTKLCQAGSSQQDLSEVPSSWQETSLMPKSARFLNRLGSFRSMSRRGWRFVLSCCCFFSPFVSICNKQQKLRP